MKTAFKKRSQKALTKIMLGVDESIVPTIQDCENAAGKDNYNIDVPWYLFMYDVPKFECKSEF